MQDIISALENLGFDVAFDFDTEPNQLKVSWDDPGTVCRQYAYFEHRLASKVATNLYQQVLIAFLDRVEKAILSSTYQGRSSTYVMIQDLDSDSNIVHDVVDRLQDSGYFIKINNHRIKISWEI